MLQEMHGKTINVVATLNFDKLKEIVQNISPFLIGLNPLLITRQLTDCRVSFQYIFVSTFVGFSLALFDNNVLYGE